MPYGQIKVDEITFTNAGVDQTISVSGVVASISGDITATGTISGNVIRGGTLVSGATVTGTAGQFGTITGNTAGFTTVTGTTVTGTTANFVTVSGTTVTGATAQFTTVTGGTAGFTTITGTTVTGTTANFVTVSGTTVTGNVGQFTTVTGGTAGFTTVTGTTITGTTLTVASGTFSGNSTAAAFIPTGSTVPTNGVYLPAANTVGVATNGTGRLFVNSSGSVGVGTSSPTFLSGSGLEIFDTSVPRLKLTNSTTGTGSSDGLDIHINNTDANIVVRENFPLIFYTNNTERLRITSAGLVGIGTTTPTDTSGYGTTLDIRGSSTGNGGVVYLGNSDATVRGQLAVYGDGRMDFGTTTNHPLKFYTFNSERARIDSSGRLLVGTSSAPVGGGVATFARLQIEGNSFGSTGPGSIALRMGTAPTSIVAGNDIGQIAFAANNNGEFARIECYADATAGNNDYPGRLVFSTTADGASSPTERMRIKNNGVFHINTGGNAPSGSQSGLELHPDGYIFTSVNAGGAAYFNRNTNDGGLVEFRQDNIAEGSISVSGTTVSYNGAHLSRWAQLPSGAERTEILRGSVLSNLDEMCEWGDEENEQLNRMKVSDVEGDKNVSGVFQAWDDDDDTYTNDFYCAMTGDFIIRIAEGTTVERGDLLMSAGDGTAKPQDDDIIRSKTIAKVTSTTVSCTYADGSYCVPCVLMAC
jgi:hypothetical protein